MRPSAKWPRPATQPYSILMIQAACDLILAMTEPLLAHLIRLCKQQTGKRHTSHNGGPRLRALGSAPRAHAAQPMFLRIPKPADLA